MTVKQNPHQLVLRRDTATGLTLVGWEADLPIGRFAHIEVICELNDHLLPKPGSHHYANYKAACQQAYDTNITMLDRQTQQHRARGWFAVPFDLSNATQAVQPDDFGSFITAAMKLLFQLTRNRKQVWAILHQGRIVHVRPRHPKTVLDELTYQVWHHQQIHQLNSIEGQLLEGKLLISESGLWFIPDKYE